MASMIAEKVSDLLLSSANRRMASKKGLKIVKMPNKRENK
jgi:hypothetical protein